MPAAQRASFERAHGFPILERGPLGQLSPGRPAADYFPITYVAARGLAVQAPLGYDVGSDTVRGAYPAARPRQRQAGGNPVMRLPVGGTGINVFRPVFRDGAPTGTVAERRAGPGRLRRRLLPGSATSPRRQRSPCPTASTSSSSSAANGRRAAAPLDEAATAPIQIADRSWLLVVRDPNRPGVDLAVMIAIVGLSLAALLAALVLVWSRNERMQELSAQASQDPLTGLKNRRRFEEDLRAELARSHRYGATGALLMLDLDHFKQVNDTLGHPAGDRVIAEIAEVLRGRARETDVLARLGGDEFAIVLPRCSSAEARSGRRRDRDRDPRATSPSVKARADHRQRRHRHLWGRRGPATKRLWGGRRGDVRGQGLGPRRVKVFEPPEPGLGEVKITSASRVSRQHVAQAQHPAGRDFESGAVGRPQRTSSRARPACHSGAEVGEEEEVGAGRAAAAPAAAGPPKSRTAAVSSASVIETPSKPSRPRSSPVAIERAKAAGLGEKAG